MSETKKFTQEELDQISKLREANSNKISEFGQLEVEILVTSQRLEALAEAKNKAVEDYSKLQNEEQDLVKELNKKYGAGTIDISTGEFTPAN